MQPWLVPRQSSHHNNAMPALEDITIDRRLLALPYRIEVTSEGWIRMTPLQAPGLTWEQLATTHPILPEDMGRKIETNAKNEILMSPPPNPRHQDHGVTIIMLLHELMKGGRPGYEIGVQTSDGTRVPDIIWMSRERRAQLWGSPSLPSSPELCVEILSPSNSKREIEEKKALYFEGGAREVWICDRRGKMSFFGPGSVLLRKSRLCPAFPPQLSADD